MTLAQLLPPPRLLFVDLIQRFCIWTFSLTVCWLVVGFPVVALLVIGTSLVAISLQAVLPFSTIMVVGGGVLAANVTFLIVGAALLTAWGVHPRQLSGVGWPKSLAQEPVVFASCPLTCDRVFLTP
ncbi:hypothetical protein C1752_00526 [Acaryochloris thomasi RCC1774]|uniref:Uncharacterized protein n=1 Tax=Acaryochloris thomasi RCC1774 TaxID=1764569 RepID=A0A2W1K6X8_9CYAN|nr:hypothetical protein [Acaryochloris thomasi]PZD75431.1 hypothetical protein C1752_00526 [Acaryochloris thomasi RCC1774]